MNDFDVVSGCTHPVQTFDIHVYTVTYNYFIAYHYYSVHIRNSGVAKGGPSRARPYQSSVVPY